MALPPVVDSVIGTLFTVLSAYFKTYAVVKEAILYHISPITNRFDLFDIILVWTVLFIIASRLYSKFQYANKRGFKKYASNWLIKNMRRLPMVGNKVNRELGEMKKTCDHDISKNRDPVKTYEIPQQGISEEALRRKATNWQKSDYKIYGDKKITGAIYYNENEKVHTLVKDIAKDYMYINPLHFGLFPTANQMEGEVISMVRKLYHGDDNSTGILTSGGTESIMTAMLAYREWGRTQGIYDAQIVAPITAHVAFEKAAFYYGMRVTYVKVNINTGVVDPYDMQDAITKDTVCLVGSFPNYPYGTCDPIEDLAAVARKHKIGMHTDCCLGGFLAPFAEKFGFSQGLFDFRVEGVTSISVDPHKYGLAPKGVSTVLFRERTLMLGSVFSYTEWPGGIYSTPTHAGSRGNAPIAGAWVALQATGITGYEDKAGKIIEATRRCVTKLQEVKALQIVGNPELGVVSFISRKKELDIYELLQKLEQKGWHLAALSNPAAIHLAITNYNIGEVNDFITTIKWGVAELLKNPPKKKGNLAQIYGTAAVIPANILKDGIKLIIESTLKP